MKISLVRVQLLKQPGRAFTLVEMMVSLAVLGLVILMTVGTQIYASRVYTLSATKLNATSTARMALNDIRDKIREGQIVNIGNYIWTGGDPALDFTPIADGSPQQGNALIIYPSAASTNTFTLMFLQPGSGTNFSPGTPSSTNSLILEAYNNGALVESNEVANFITNQIVFSATDYTGTNILTQNVNNRVIQVQLFFSQWEFPIAHIGTNTYNAYDYYRLQTRVTRRLVN